MLGQRNIVVTCGKGVSKILAHEIESLGYSIAKVNPLSVEVTGNLRDCMILNLHLRTANKVLLLIKRFKAAHPDHLYRALSKIPWEDYLHTKGYLCVTSHIQNPYILDTRFGNQRVKDAIVDRIFSQKGQRPDSGPSREQSVIYLHWVDNDCHIYFDTSGETISKHGYRKIPFKAPLRESLAAALIKASHWETDKPFINPMAGSGTLAIEAAMMASNRVPGLVRENFGFMHLKGYQEEEWISLRKEASHNIISDLDIPITVNDTSLEAIRAAKKNAEWAGVAGLISYQHGNFSKVEIPSTPGVVMLNPGYGTRLGEVNELRHYLPCHWRFF